MKELFQVIQLWPRRYQILLGVGVAVNVALLIVFWVGALSLTRGRQVDCRGPIPETRKTDEEEAQDKLNSELAQKAAEAAFDRAKDLLHGSESNPVKLSRGATPKIVRGAGTPVSMSFQRPLAARPAPRSPLTVRRPVLSIIPWRLKI